MLAEIVARQPPSGGSRPVSIGSRSIGVSLQPANSSAGCSPAEPASASPVTDNSSSIPIRRGNQMRCSTSLQGCSQSSVTCLGEPTYGSIRMSFALAQRLVVMPSPLIVSAEPECHLYFARRVTFLSCADTACKRHIEMTPLCKIEVTHPRVLGSREVRRGGVVDEQAGVQPS